MHRQHFGNIPARFGFRQVSGKIRIPAAGIAGALNPPALLRQCPGSIPATFRQDSDSGSSAFRQSWQCPGSTRWSRGLGVARAGPSSRPAGPDRRSQGRFVARPHGLHMCLNDGPRPRGLRPRENPGMGPGPRRSRLGVRCLWRGVLRPGTDARAWPGGAPARGLWAPGARGAQVEEGS